MPLTPRRTNFSALRLIRRMGKLGTLRVFEDTGQLDEHGDPVLNEVESQVLMSQSFGTDTRQPQPIDLPVGESRNMAFNFFLASTDAPPVDDIPPTGKVPEIDFENATYKVLEAEDMLIGVTRLLCESMRT